MAKQVSLDDLRWIIRETIFEVLGHSDGHGNIRSEKPSGNGKPESVATILVDSIEAARMLGISERTLWELRRRGDLPFVTIGSGSKRDSIRYAVSDLYDLVTRRKVAVVSSATIANADGRPNRAE